MSFDWAQYIVLAETLYRSAETSAEREACLRSAISRAYYGAYGLAREVAAMGGAQLKGSYKDHGIVTAYFSNSSQPSYRQISLELRRLRRARNQADYDDLYQDLDRQTQIALRRARYIERLLP